MKEIVDSQLDLAQALADNPENPAPEAIQQSLGLSEVEYWGFDERLHIGQIGRGHRRDG